MSILQLSSKQATKGFSDAPVWDQEYERLEVHVLRNITLSLPVNVLRQIKHIAARRQASVSKLLAQTLEDMAAREDGCAQVPVHHQRWLEQAADLGTRGQIKWLLESLHER